VFRELDPRSRLASVRCDCSRVVVGGVGRDDGSAEGMALKTEASADPLRRRDGKVRHVLSQSCAKSCDEVH